LKAKAKSFWPVRARRRSLSNRVFVDALFSEGGPKSSFEHQPTLSPLEPEVFSALPEVKELELKVMKEVRERALFIEKEAYEKGFEQGEKDGRELGLKRMELVIRQLQDEIQEIGRQRKAFFQNYRKDILTLLLHMAKRIFRQELLTREETILATLEEAFQYVMDRSKVSIRLHPSDYQYLLTHRDQAPFPMSQEGIEIIEDRSITRGGCLLETSFGEVDATFESQFDEMVLLIQRKLEGNAGDPHP